MSYVLGISDNLPTSPLTFIRPDVLVHIHDLWVKQKHDQITHRSFTAVSDLSALRPFVVVGLDHVMNYVRNWRFSDSDIEFLQSLPSCSTFQAPFWLYLRNIQKFPGNIRGVREGEIYGTSPMQMSDELRRDYHYEGKSPFPLLDIEGPSAHVALMSEFIFNILSQATLTSMIALERRRSLKSSTHFYGIAELRVHPLYALLDNRADAILSNRPISMFEQRQNTVAIRMLKDREESTAEIREIHDRLRTLHSLSVIFVFMK